MRVQIAACCKQIVGFCDDDDTGERMMGHACVYNVCCACHISVSCACQLVSLHNSLIDKLKATRDPLLSLIHPYTVLVYYAYILLCDLIRRVLLLGGGSEEEKTINKAWTE